MGQRGDVVRKRSNTWIQAGRRAAPLLIALVCSVTLHGQAHAHGGGLDRYGCHRETRTGTRHCHNGNEPLAVSPKLEGIISFERLWPTATGDQLGLFGGLVVQHDGTVLMLVGLSAYFHQLGSRTWTYVDLGVGPAIFPEGESVISLRTSLGIKTSLVHLGSDKRDLYLKVGAFLELLGDGVNDEPAGLHGTIGVSF